MLKDKEFREEFVSEGVETALPMQIRANREARGLNQEQFAELMGKKQTAVSRIESVSYGKMTLRTLKEVAAALDVALLVRLVPFSRLTDDYLSFSPKNMVAASFDDERLEESSAEYHSAIIEIDECLSTQNLTRLSGIGPESTGIEQYNALVDSYT